MSAEEKVAPEAAEAEFQRWAEAMDVAWKFDAAAMKEMDDEDRKSFLSQKRVIVDAIRFGRLACDDSGDLRFTPQMGNQEPIVFHEPTGANLLAIDKAGKNGHGVTKTFAVLGEITGQPPQRFSGLKNRDLAVCQAILGFLLGK